MIFHWSGIALVSALSLFLLGSMVTGLVVYKRFWRGFFRKPRLRDRRTFWGDMHRLAGLWSLWFIFLMGLTGTWYLVEVLGAQAPDPPRDSPARERPALADAGLTRLAARAETALDDFRVRTVVLPQQADDPVGFLGQTDTLLVRDRANRVIAQPETGKIVAVSDSADMSAHQRISEAADPLHFGTFAGLPSKLVYFVFGIALSGMALSGVYIYSRRIRHAAEGAEARPRAGAARLEPAQ